jgi:hypothetical protein
MSLNGFTRSFSYLTRALQYSRILINVNTHNRRSFTMAPARLEPPKIRMLVLETDEPHPDTQSEQGSFGQVLHNLLEDAGKKHDPELGIETKMQYCVEPDGGKIPAPEDIEEGVHAVLITGSVYDAHSDEPWILKLLDLVKRMSFSYTNNKNKTQQLTT